MVIPSVVSLLHNDKSDGWLKTLLQLLAGLPHGDQLLRQDSQELALAATIPEDDNLLGFATPVGLKELHQKLLRDIFHVLDDLFRADETHVLDPHLDLVVDSPWFHTSHTSPPVLC